MKTLLSPFLGFDVEIRKIVCSTNAIESVNARIRRAVRARGHFPNETAALKCVYLAIMSLDPTGIGRPRSMSPFFSSLRFMAAPSLYSVRCRPAGRSGGAAMDWSGESQDRGQVLR